MRDPSRPRATKTGFVCRFFCCARGGGRERAIRNTKLSSEIAEALEGCSFPLLPHGTTQRVIYPTSAATEQTVFSEPGNPAINEIEAIAKDALELLP